MRYVSVTDGEAVEASFVLARLEGILPAIESAHALADALRVAPTMSPEETIVINLSGRGDKDMPILQEVAPHRFAPGGGGENSR